MFTEAGKEPVRGAAWECNPQGESFGRERKSTGRIQIKQLILAKGKNDSLSLLFSALKTAYPFVSALTPSHFSEILLFGYFTHK